MENDEACIMHLTPGVVHSLPKAVGVSIECLSPKLKSEEDNPGNYGLLSQ